MLASGSRSSYERQPARAWRSWHVAEDQDNSLPFASKPELVDLHQIETILNNGSVVRIDSKRLKARHE
jgi:hypothetical protein